MTGCICILIGYFSGVMNVKICLVYAYLAPLIKVIVKDMRRSSAISSCSNIAFGISSTVPFVDLNKKRKVQELGTHTLRVENKQHTSTFIFLGRS